MPTMKQVMARLGDRYVVAYSNSGMGWKVVDKMADEDMFELNHFPNEEQAAQRASKLNERETKNRNGILNFVIAACPELTTLDLASLQVRDAPLRLPQQPQQADLHVSQGPRKSKSFDPTVPLGEPNKGVTNPPQEA